MVPLVNLLTIHVNLNVSFFHIRGIGALAQGKERRLAKVPFKLQLGQC